MIVRSFLCYSQVDGHPDAVEDLVKSYALVGCDIGVLIALGHYCYDFRDEDIANTAGQP